MTVRQCLSDNDRLVLEAVFTASPSALFKGWTEPELLTRWWPQEATLEPRVGGAYHFAYPRMGWHLRGRFKAFEPGERLSFTWAWDHERDLPEREVEVLFEALSQRGTRMTLIHGFYTDSQADQDDRRSHLEGWLHFLPGLEGLSQGE